jgi:hypothetical protein
LGLQDQWATTQEERFLFLAVEQIDLVSSDHLLGRLSQDDILGLISLHHQASKLAAKKGRMQSVSAFLNKAISSAGPSSWRFHYQTMLEIYNFSAEAEFGLGRLNKSI